MKQSPVILVLMIIWLLFGFGVVANAEERFEHYSYPENYNELCYVEWIPGVYYRHEVRAHFDGFCQDPNGYWQAAHGQNGERMFLPYDWQRM